MESKKFLRKAVSYLFVFFLMCLLAYGLFFAKELYFLKKKITVTPNGKYGFLDNLKNLSSSHDIQLKGQEKDRVNILLLGLPGKNKPGQNLTDTIMISSINLKSNQVALLSIPRDFYVEIPQTQEWMKINSVYQHEINRLGEENLAAETLSDIVEKITSLDINYYVILNFDGFTQVIDALGGINIMNERDIYDPRYPGPNYSYEVFELKKGFHHLDGSTALKYARERHNDPEGDFGRAKRQQQILEATKNKAFSTKTLLNFITVNDLFKTLGANIKTNITEEEIDDFIELIKKVDTNNINNVVLNAWSKDSLIKVSHIYYGNIRAFILVPRVGNYSEIHDLSQNVFDLNIIKRRKEEISKENATIAIINKSGDSSLTEKIKKLLSENLSYKNVIVINSLNRSIEENTLVYNITPKNKPFTLDELITKLPARAINDTDTVYTEDIKNISVDVLAILGKDLAGLYNMEEDSIEEYQKAEDTNEYSEFIDQ